MKPKLALKGLKFNKEAYSKALDEVLDIQIRQAARAWLRAVYPLVPVWTGESRGSLIPLGQYLRIAIPIVRNPSADRHGYSWRNEAHGIPKGHFNFEHLKTLVRFSFSTDVKQYIINEESNPNPPIHLIHSAPWKSFEAGREAFFAYLRENLSKKLPQLKKYVEFYDLEYP
jgi:hypothetical protein